jgi:hypothetical protein
VPKYRIYGIIASGSLTTGHTMNIEHTRFNMIAQQIRPWDVSDQHVLALLDEIKR